MAKYIEFGNILDVKEGLIVHGCNAFSIMGGGVALQVKQKYPGAFEDYVARLKKAKDNQEDPLGQVYDYKVNDKLVICSCITQFNYGREPGKRYVNYKAVQSAFAHVAILSDFYQLPVHYVQIGAGLGGGDWSLISEIIDVELQNTVRTLWIYEA